MEINLELRTQVLEYALKLEHEVNGLLLMHLGILDGGRDSRLFGTKASISFKNKIDFLYDIDVLSKEENYYMELFSVFRNKLLHDLNSNSLNYILNHFDNGIKNKFKQFFDGGMSIDNEVDCKLALSKLYEKNSITIRDKVKSLSDLQSKKTKYLQLQNEFGQRYLKILSDLIFFIRPMVLEIKPRNKKAYVLSQEINSKLDEVLSKLLNQEFPEILRKNDEFADESFLASLYGIRRSPPE